MHEKLASLHKEIFSKSAKELIFAQAPGKVNLIGNHIDYNDGYVMPIGIDKYIYGAASPRIDKLINVYSDLYREKKSIKIENIVTDENCNWINYIAGVAKCLNDRGEDITGVDMVILSTLPSDCGLGSSAALEVLTGFLLLSLIGKNIDLKELAILCKKAENEFVGVECGIMDQFISAKAKKGMVMFIDCVKLDFEYIPFDEMNYAIVLCDTKKPRTLAASEYNIRKAESRKGLDIIKANFPAISSFRDINYEHISGIKSDELSYTIFKRLIHIFTEIDRVKKSKEFLSGRNYKRFGKEFFISHESSRNLYEVSCRELDIMVDLGSKFPGVLGSKLTGAGFGGSTIHLIEKKIADEFIKYMKLEYSKTTGIMPDVYLIETSHGVKII